MIAKNDISQLTKVSEGVRQELAAELRAADVNWKQAYGEYQSGGWYVAPLANSQGSEDQLKLDAGAPCATPLLGRMPSVQRFLDSTELDYRLVRLARIAPGAFMHEHNDEVGIQQERLRLHLPITTQPDAVLSFDGVNVHAAEGYLWKLDHERVAHAAANFGKTGRVHLIVDCLVNDRLRELVAGEALDQSLVLPKPILSVAFKRELMACSIELLHAGQQQKAEDRLLATFSRFDLQGGSSYDLLIEMYESLPHYTERLEYWRERLKEVRGRTERLQ
ncbi:MAG: aspartyl/asparaginyl beta-hydroxylase domain-containing protein [Proteobacteria bacterium]|nr:aspartyl/asparaginyl beta-hydroxylase domain-containing protein [Pseudomonadota bacterium]